MYAYTYVTLFVPQSRFWDKLLRGTIVNRTYGMHKKPIPGTFHHFYYQYLVLPTMIPPYTYQVLGTVKVYLVCPRNGAAVRIIVL